MWKILKAELSYNKYVLVIPYGVVLYVIIANVSQGWSNVELNLPGVRAMMVVAAAVIFLFSIVTFFKEKRERYFTLLPLSIRQIGISRLLFLITVWLSFILLFWISTLTVTPYQLSTILWGTLSLTGFILMANAYIFIHRDLKFCSSGKFQKILITFFYPIMIIIGYLLWYLLFAVPVPYFEFFKPLNTLNEEFSNISTSLMGFSIFIVLGMSFTVLSVFVFKRRRSYLE